MGLTKLKEVILLLFYAAILNLLIVPSEEHTLLLLDEDTSATKGFPRLRRGIQIADSSAIKNDPIMDLPDAKETQSDTAESASLQLPSGFMDEASTSGHTLFVLTGHKALLTCSQSADDLDLLQPTFVWKDTRGRPVTHGRIQIQDNGDLYIEDAQPEDTGRYTCSIKVDSEERQKDQTQLLVYKVPSFSYSFTYVYHVASCESLKAREKVDFIRSSLCNSTDVICPFHVTSSCHRHRGLKEELWVHVAQTPRDDFALPHCNITCMKNTIIKHMDKLYVNAEKLSESEDASSTSEIRYDPTRLARSLKHSCAGGYRDYKQTLCIPCHPGTYSPEGQMTCVSCMKNSYQDGYANTACYPCPKNGTTEKDGAKSGDDCKASDEVVKLKLTLTQKEAKQDAEYLGVVLGVLIPALLIAAGCAYYQKKKKKKVNDGPTGEPWLPPYIRSFLKKNKESSSEDEAPLLGDKASQKAQSVIDIEQPRVSGHAQIEAGYSSRRMSQAGHDPRSRNSLRLPSLPLDSAVHLRPVKVPSVSPQLPPPMPTSKASSSSWSSTASVMINQQSLHSPNGQPGLVPVHKSGSLIRKTSAPSVKSSTGPKYSFQDIDDVIGPASSRHQGAGRSLQNVNQNNLVDHYNGSPSMTYRDIHLNNNANRAPRCNGFYLDQLRRTRLQGKPPIPPPRSQAKLPTIKPAGLAGRISSWCSERVQSAASSPGLTSITSLLGSEAMLHKVHIPQRSRRERLLERYIKDKWMRSWQRKCSAKYRSPPAPSSSSASSSSEDESTAPNRTSSTTLSRTSTVTSCTTASLSRSRRRKRTSVRRDGSSVKADKCKNVTNAPENSVLLP